MQPSTHNVPARADIEPQQPPQTEITEKKRRISKRLSDAINLLVTGECKTQKAAAERVGMYPHSLSRELSKPHVRVFYERRARENIAAGVLRASARLVDLMDASSEHVSFDAAKHVLAIQGIKPANDAQVSVNIDVKAGFVIDLTPPTTQQSDRMLYQEGHNPLKTQPVDPIADRTDS